MAGIVSAGAYIPMWRLDLKTSRNGLRGERAVASYDEDSLTMGVAAGLNCLGDIDPGTIDALFFATTTSPYKEKEIAVTAALALDLRENILTADFSDSLRAGTTALKLAADAVKAGSAKQVMVIVADRRMAMPGSTFEGTFGDGAAAFIVGSENIMANIKDSCSLADEILDVWKAEDDKFVRSWEDRFILDEGYLRVLPIAVRALMKKNSLAATDFNKAVFYAPDSSSHRSMANKLGLNSAQVQEPMFGSLGDTGAAFSLILLAAALEEAKPGEKILLASYGSGADAVLIETTAALPSRRSVKEYVASKKIFPDYKTYLWWRGILEMTPGRRRPPVLTPSASALWRERNKNYRLYGVRCKQCGLIQYPPQRVCFDCGSKDQFENYKFAGREGKLTTFSMDYITNSYDPPVINSVIDFAGGGRMFLSMTDKDKDEVAVGMPVELTFRKLYSAEGIHNYFWKCMPVRIPARAKGE